MENIKSLILQDEKFMGSVARGVTDGKTHEQIAEEAGQKTTMMTHIFLKAIKVLTGKMEYGEVKQASQEQAYFKSRKWRTSSAITADEKDHLEHIISQYENSGDTGNNARNVHKSINSDPVDDKPVVNTARDTRTIQNAPTTTETRSGVYVYSYPLYLENPISPHDGRTLYKVGASSTSAGKRVQSQAEKTPVPEDIKLLRVFECSDAIKEERKFHRILTSAGHHHDSNHGGIEWFLTRVELIDAIAESLGLFNSVGKIQ